jgi:hypothetical protein
MKTRNSIEFVTLAVVFFAGAARGADLDYEKDILPILMKKCADCHSAESGKVKGGIKFDDIAHFKGGFGEDGKGVVVPGNWDSSALFVTVFRPSDDDDVMPPKGKGERLNLAEIKLVMQWIADGAPVAGERGPRGAMPERIEDLFLDLPPEMAAKLAKELEVKPEAEKPAPVEADWTNREGRSIRATLLRVEKAEAVFRMPDGREIRYPLANLADESRARAEKSNTALSK